MIISLASIYRTGVSYIQNTIGQEKLIIILASYELSKEVFISDSHYEMWKLCKAVINTIIRNSTICTYYQTPGHMYSL